MWSGVAVLEYFFSISLWLVTFALMTETFHRHSPRHLFKNSPHLFSVLVAIIFMGVFAIPMLAQWLLVILGKYPHFEENAKCCYDLATLLLFIERILILLLPLHSSKICNRILSVITVAASIVCVVCLFSAHFKWSGEYENFLPAGCYGFMCCSASTSGAYNYSALIRTTLSFTIILAGSLFAFLLGRDSRFQSLTNQKANKLSTYIFVTRVFVELAPYLVEIVVTITTRRSVAFYIGPFGSVGCAVESFCCTAMYFYVFKPKTMVSPRPYLAK
ncbi:hypothetical protein QR680_016474 [Steinernema hermaphroditum]|uniref:Uncharacterized protein n=1 Tax=Steinernema hermaphroditum TaxID=289476 RepID=A0AA39HDH3_9BILA|nr:hypothetical protein QR680_016474 [Steinernema hermaphroditum]